MNATSDQEEAIESLQQLGLQEYEARAFVALTRLSTGTAKQVSEISDVPRTRVYDAVRVLESNGLVEIQHSNPQQFRAVSIEEAIDTFQQKHETRTDRLRENLASLETVDSDDKADITHEVWALSDRTGITNRTQQLIDEADSEIVFVLGDETVLTDTLVARLQAAHRRGVTINFGTTSEAIRERVRAELPQVDVFVSGLDWLSGSLPAEDETAISRLVLVDESAILVSTYREPRTGEHDHEQAVFGRGFDNGIVTITRRLMKTGLGNGESPGLSES